MTQKQRENAADSLKMQGQRPEQQQANEGQHTKSKLRAKRVRQQTNAVPRQAQGAPHSGPASPSTCTSAPHAASSATPTRTRLSAEARRTQILDIARELFVTRGYHHTSTDDILARAGIAKGTLYHHFASKEEILRALVLRTCDDLAARAEAAAHTPSSAIERFVRTIGALRITGDEEGEHLVNTLHAPGNADYHLLSITETIARITPILVDVVEEGVNTGEFTTPHPTESVELIMLGAGMLLDQGIFPADEATLARRTQALIVSAGRILGCEPQALAEAMGAEIGGQHA